MPDEKPFRTQTVHGRVHHHHTVRLRPTAAYAEAVIRFEDGGQHIFPVSKQKKDRGISLEEAEAVWMAFLEARMNDPECPPQRVERYAARKIVGVE